MLSVVSSNRSGDNSVSHLTNAFGPMASFRGTDGGGGGNGGIAGHVAAEEELVDAEPVATSELDEEPVATEEELADTRPVATRELDEEPVTTREPKLGFEESLGTTGMSASCSLRIPGQPQQQTLYRLLSARLAPIPLRKLPGNREIVAPRRAAFARPFAEGGPPLTQC